MLRGKLDVQMSEIFVSLEKEVEKLEVRRVNSAMLLKALLEARVSPLYEALLDEVEEFKFFPELLDETYSYIQDTKVNTDCSIEEIQFGYLYSNEEHTLSFSMDLKETMEILVWWMQLREIVTINDFTAIFVSNMPTDVIRILRTFGISTGNLEKIFHDYLDKLVLEEEKKANISDQLSLNPYEIPEKFKGFVKNLNEVYAGTNCDISGRDKECKLIWQTMLKNTKKNVVLIGEPGVGKTSVVQKITYDIISGNCPDELKGFTVLSLDVTSSVAGTSYRGQAEERYSAFAEFLENQKNIIVFIDEIHLIKGAGACREGEIDLANALKPILAGGNVRIIGATTNEEYQKYFSQDGAIKRRFRPIVVREPKMKEVYPMLKKSIETLSKYHGVSISRKW